MSWAQTTVSIFGDKGPAMTDGGDSKSVVLGIKIFSDVPGRVMGCSFYKAPANTGAHVVSLWDSAGKLLASQTAAGETASGKQSVMFSSPVTIAAKQTVTCAYYAPNGHYAYERSGFAAQKDVPPLHAPVNAGVFVYGTKSTARPTGVWMGSNYGVDVLFAPSTGGSATWISGATVTAAGGTASITWKTAVPSDSQVEYGSTTLYGATSPLNSARVTAHSVAIGGLQPGTTYHFRIRSRDSDEVLAIGLDNTLATAAAVSISMTPSTATAVSGATQQFTASVGNTTNSAVTWSATAGSVSGSGLFTAPKVSAATSVIVTATSQADPSKSASATLTVNPVAPVLAVNPASLSFAGDVGASLSPSSVNVTNTGAGSLTFTGTSDQSWLVLSPRSGTAPSALQVSPSITGLKAGTYTGHVTVVGGGETKVVTVALTVTTPPVQHSVTLSWKISTNPNVVTYNLYRSTTPGSPYVLIASAVGGITYSDQTVQAGTQYYYVVTAVDDQGRESDYSNESRAVIP